MSKVESDWQPQGQRIPPLAPELPTGDTTELLIDQRQGPIERRAVAPAGIQEKLRDIVQDVFSQ